MTVILIAGMHRSGTSMITRLLNLCGVSLGTESEMLPPDTNNTEGYWENRQFVQINDQILTELGGGWDYPPNVDPGWQLRPQFVKIKSDAEKVLQAFSSYAAWGWKDPRNSLTLPFWMELIPSMKVVVCVRNPLEVANSLLKRNYFSLASGFNLWFEYNRRILSATEPENRIITNYTSYFYDPYSELARILKFLQIEISEERLKKCDDALSTPLRHNQSTMVDLLNAGPRKVIRLYAELCLQSGPVLKQSPQFDLAAQTLSGEALQDTHVELERSIIAESPRVAQKQQSIEELQTRINEINRELEEIKNSRAWHSIQTYRRIRAKFRLKTV